MDSEPRRLHGGVVIELYHSIRRHAETREQLQDMLAAAFVQVCRLPPDDVQLVEHDCGQKTEYWFERRRQREREHALLEMALIQLCRLARLVGPDALPDREWERVLDTIERCVEDVPWTVSERAEMQRHSDGDT